MPLLRTTSPKQAIAILAAGASRRLGQPKQLVRVDGNTLLQRAVDAARATRAEVWLALGSEGDPFWDSLRDREALLRIDVPDASTGMSASLRAVARHAQAAKIERLLVLLVDQHRVDSFWLTEMLQLSETFPERIIASVHEGLRGAPAVFPRARFDDLCRLEGDAGARHLLRSASHSDLVEFPAPRAPGDIDRIEDLPR